MEKKIKKILAVILTLVSILAISMIAVAENKNDDGYAEYNGVVFETKADKEKYNSGDTAEYTIIITNTNNYAVSDIGISYTLTSNFGIKVAELPKNVDVIKAGESKEISFSTIVTSDSAAETNLLLIIIIVIVVVMIIGVSIFLIINSKKKRKKTFASMLIITLLAGSIGVEFYPATEAFADEVTNEDFTRVGVHDPSIVKDPQTGIYYIFGTHKSWAKSSNLIGWESFTTNINNDYDKLLGELYKKYVYSEYYENGKLIKPQLNGNLWAPDVIYNEKMSKWCMYMSVNGANHHSVIALLTSDNIEGPYEYVDGVMYSGLNGSSEGYSNSTSEPEIFSTSKKITVNTEEVTLKMKVQFTVGGTSEVSDEIVDRAEYSDVYKVLGEGADLSRYNNTDISKVNAIDPNLQYDENGDLWMTYGSWSAGIYQIKIDEETGLRDYNYTYEYVKNESDPYLGYKLAGGFYNSGEGPYILKTDDYYYLYISLGNLETSGGYNMRVFRSENINGPYVDEAGNSAIYTSWKGDAGFREDKTASITAKYNTPIGIKQMGAYSMYGILQTQVAQGHNSAFVDDDGKMYVIYHTRFAGTSEAFQTRVHQLFINEDGWLCTAPYEYSGETISETGYSVDNIVGNYDLILHDYKFVYAYNSSGDKGVAQPKAVTLNADGTITGEAAGTWKTTTDANVVMTIDGVEYKGVFLEQQNELVTRDMTMTFTLIGGNQSMWGVKNPNE